MEIVDFFFRENKNETTIFPFKIHSDFYLVDFFLTFLFVLWKQFFKTTK